MGYDDLTEWEPDDEDDTATIEAAYADLIARDLVQDNSPDPDAPDPEQVAYHEAGHAIAAVLCAVGWKEVRVNDGLMSDGEIWGVTTPVAEHLEDTAPANLAFIAWAGCWAEARYLASDDPWRVLAAVQERGGRGDMERVNADYWDDPAHAPHETAEQWARSLGSAWKQVEALAQRLARERVVRTSLHPEWEG